MRSLLALALTWLSFLAPARAEYWAMPAGELLRTASRVEVMEVSSVHDGRVEGRVVEAVRGARLGETHGIDVPYAQHLPSPGDRFLIVCDSVCPRAWGALADGHFVLTAHQPMDGAEVLPGLVRASAVSRLANGRSAPEHCVRADVSFPGNPSDAFTVEASVSAENGQGVARGGPVPAASHARLLVPHGLGLDEPSAVTLRVRVNGHFIALIGGPYRFERGCLRFDAVVAQPVARTRRELDAAIAGNPPTRVVASGTLRLRAVRGLSAGAHPLSVVVDGNGSVLLRSPAFAGEAIRLISRQPGHNRIGVNIGADAYPMLELELGPPGPHASAGIAWELLDRVRRGAHLPVTFYGEDPASGHFDRAPAGEAILAPR